MASRTVIPVPLWSRVLPVLSAAMFCVVGVGWLKNGDRLGALMLVPSVVNLGFGLLLLVRGGHQLLPEGIRPYGWLWRTIAWQDITSTDTNPSVPSSWGQVYLHRRGRRPKRLGRTTSADRTTVERARLSAMAGDAAVG